MELADNGKDVLVTIDASKAAQPEGYPFSIEQVIDAVATCVKIMYLSARQTKVRSRFLFGRASLPNDA